MASKRGKMSTELKLRLARELGIEHKVEGDYFGNISSRDCGALVRQAIAHAEAVLAGGVGQVTRGTAPRAQ
jgi:small acid-soluble spore protein F (minor alpha/beta-type SASP)